MFTGLVQALVPALSLEPRGTGARLRVARPQASPGGPGEPGQGGDDGWELAAGESVSVSGACLTVAGVEEEALAFDLSAETLERTWLGEAVPGRALNLERSLRLCDRLGGHLVSGHVDGLGRLRAIEDSGDAGRLLTFEAEEEGFGRYLVEKGSVAVDGVSLTVVRPEGAHFQVALIPETLARTSLGTAREGDRVHLEADLVGKWIERMVRTR